MLSIQRNILIRQRYLHHGVVFLIVFLIFSDLALPQVCCEDLNCATDIGSVSLSVDNCEEDVLAASPIDQRDHHSERSKSETGCYCCCAHFLHTCVQLSNVQPDNQSLSNLPV